jgi:hypothetical protein
MEKLQWGLEYVLEVRATVRDILRAYKPIVRTLLKEVHLGPSGDRTMTRLLAIVGTIRGRQ